MNSMYYKTVGFNGEPVIVKITGLKTGSSNVKTGNMVQTYILPEHWVTNRRYDKDDEANCGDCPLSLRGDGSCYVTEGSSLMGLISTLKHPADEPYNRRKLMEALKGKFIRFGTYGDPVLMLEPMVSEMVSATGLQGWTGYTHQWRKPEYQWAKEYFMASADSEEDARQAEAMGWKYFRVGEIGTKPQGKEIHCPASHEMGRVSTCNRCLLCSGHRGRGMFNVFIWKHDLKSKRKYKESHG